MRKSPNCKKCDEPLRGHMGKNKEICPSEHGYKLTEDGKFKCRNVGCDKTFTIVFSAHKHSMSSSCEYFEGEEERVECPNDCGKSFGGGNAKGNALTHSKSLMCSKHPERINNPLYKTTIKHTIKDGLKYCNQCKEHKPIDQFATKEKLKNDTMKDYVCYKCRAILGMFGNLKKRAKKENNELGLTLNEFKQLLVDICPVFGYKLQYGGNEGCSESATVDARIHSKGHIKENIKIISHRANTIKNNSTLEEMKKLVDALENWTPPVIEETTRKRINVKKTSKEQTTKKCPLCNEEKEISMFHANNDTQMGVSTKCIRCSALSTMVKNAKNRSKEKQFPIEIDMWYLYNLTKGLTHCPVLGVELLFGGQGKIHDNSASIDRFDPSKGYIKGNVWIISYKANRMKSDATIDEIKKVYNYML